jgi:hypothetical protein
MPQKTYKDTTFSLFITICLFSFLFAVLSTVQYYKNKDDHPSIADRDHEELTISWIIFTVSGCLAICTHNMYFSKKQSTSVPV